MKEIVQKGANWFDDRSGIVLTLLLGGALFLSPFVFGYFPETTASWNAWVLGLALLAAATAAKQVQSWWPEWLVGVGGVWAMVAPWILNFHAQKAAYLSHEFIGLFVAVIAATRLWAVHSHKQQSPHATA